nr:MAG TPA: hypothetical protein [Caudoviricetes sp.]
MSLQEGGKSDGSKRSNPGKGHRTVSGFGGQKTRWTGL